MKTYYFLLSICSFFSLASFGQNTTQRLDSLFAEYLFSVPRADQAKAECTQFFLIEEKDICENLDFLKKLFSDLEQNSRIIIELYQELLFLRPQDEDLKQEAFREISRHMEAVMRIDTSLQEFFIRCSR